MDSLGVSWLDGYGEVKEVEAIREIDVNGDGAAAEQVKPPIRQVRRKRDLPPCREGQRLMRVQDWVEHGPYWLVAQNNGRILKMGISELQAMDYLLQIGFQQTHVDQMTYSAVIWANRQGTQRPLYPLREDDPLPLWDVLTAQEVV